MSYSGGMSQYAQENLSGADLCEAWHEEQRRLIDEIHEVTTNQIRRIVGTAQPEAAKRVASPIDAYKQPL